MTFQVGDRVKAISEFMGNKEIINQIGTIIFTDQQAVVVEFDNHVNGHRGGVCNGKKGYCWNFPINTSCLQIISPYNSGKKEKHMLQVGDRVKVLDPESTYSRYSSWIETFAPTYFDCWREYRTPREIYQDDEKKNNFLIVVKAKHEINLKTTLYLIQAYNGYVYIMAEDAITPINHHLQVGNIVHITDTQFVYEDYEDWLIKNGLSHEIRKRWHRNALPIVGEMYRVIKKAPKAEFLPFCETDLCLISGPLEATGEGKNAFIIEENALFLDMYY